LFQNASSSSNFTTVILEALDLTQMCNVVYNAFNYSIGDFLIKDCKLSPRSVINSPLSTNQIVQAQRSSSTQDYTSARYAYEGVETTETQYVRATGFVDPLGKAQSRKIVTSSTVQWLRPYRAEPFVVWNAKTGADVVIKVRGTAQTTVLNNDDIWLELQYLGSNAYPLGSMATTTKAHVWDSNAVVDQDYDSVWPSHPTRLDPTYVSIYASLSPDGLTLTNSSMASQTWARNIDYMSSGKYYYETVTRGVSTLDSFGLFPASNTVASYNGNSFTAGFSVNGLIYVGSGYTGKGIGNFAYGDVAGVAVDFSNSLAWARRNNGTWNGTAGADPATGVGGIAISAVSMAPAVVYYASSTANMTVNFGATPYANPAPVGFANWPNIWTNFVLTATLNNPQPAMTGYIYVRVRIAKPGMVFYIDPRVEMR
jgi:hypothetical protein